MGALSGVYAGLAKAEKGRFANESQFYSGLRNTISEALTNVNDIAAKLKSSAPPTPAFVQTSIKKVTDSYAKVFNVNIDNDAAKRRICAWLDDIRGTFANMFSDINVDTKSRSENNGKFEALLKKSLKPLRLKTETSP